jgi:2-polyprenyl-3-methyl-5-hydroxy-6-metoxy-1,4-benzoquinol methylase
MTMPDRPPLTERTTYAPKHKSETFIVPHLATAISTAIEKYASGGKALDVGCGGQPFRAALESRGCKYFSLDVSPTPGVSVDFLSPIDAPLPPALIEAGPYDFILCTEVLEHVADWPRAFENLAKLLAPNGKLLLTAPHFYFLHEEPYDFFRPTLHAFAHFAARHNLTVLESKQLGDAWDLLGTLLSSCRFKSADDSRLSRALAWTLWKLRDFCFRRIQSRSIRRRVNFSGPTYLSNFVVLAANSD